MKSSAAMVMVNRLSTNHKGWLVPEGSGVERLNAAATMIVCEEGGGGRRREEEGGGGRREEEGGRGRRSVRREEGATSKVKVLPVHLSDGQLQKCFVYCHVTLCVYN